MTRFLDHVVRSARTANAGLEAAERRSPPPAAGARAPHDDETADAPQTTADDPAARQVTRDELRAQAPARRPVEVSGVRADLAARPSPADERTAERARASLTPRRAQTELLAGAWIAAGSHTPGPTSPAGARATARAARLTALAAAAITDAAERPPLRSPQQPVPVAAPTSPPVVPSAQPAPAAPTSAPTGTPPAHSGDPPPSARGDQTELLAGAWIAAGSHTPGPTSPAGARATAEAARSTALASATITDAGRRPPARDPQQPVPVAAPASPPAAPRTQAAPAIPAPRMAAPQSPTPPARELHIEHLDVRVIQEPPPRAAVRPPSPASNATARGAWRPAARRFLKQP